MKNVDIKDGLFYADRIIDSLIQTFFILHWQNHKICFSSTFYQIIISFFMAIYTFAEKKKKFKNKNEIKKSI